jgi:hypothetical protein
VRAHPSTAATAAPWPLAAWPDVPTRFVLCTEDRFFPPDFFRRLVPDAWASCPTKSPAATGRAQPPERGGDMLEGYAATVSRPSARSTRKEA